MEPQTEDLLRRFFRSFNQFMLLLWRLGLGWHLNAWPSVGGRIMVLTHTGRKTGRRLQTPVNYVEIDGDVYCVAGFGQLADWYRNLRAHAAVEVWLPQGWWSGAAEDVTGCEKHAWLMRQVLIASGFAAYAAGLDPQNMSDEQLAEATKDYRLVRIHRTAERTGPGGPGELAWIWPVLTFLLLPMALRRRKR